MWWCDHLGRKRRSTSYKRRLRSARAAAAAAASRGQLPPGETTASKRKCCASALRWPRLLPRAAPSMPLGKCRPCAAAAPRWPRLGHRRPQAWRQAPRRAPWVPAAPRRRRVERLSRRIRNAGMCCATQAAQAHHAPPTSPLPSEPTPRTRSVAERACSTHLGALAAEPARYMASHMAHATSYMYIHSYFSDSRVSVFHHPPPRAKKAEAASGSARARTATGIGATRAIREPADRRPAEERRENREHGESARAPAMNVCIWMDG